MEKKEMIDAITSFLFFRMRGVSDEIRKSFICYVLEKENMEYTEEDLKGSIRATDWDKYAGKIYQYADLYSRENPQPEVIQVMNRIKFECSQLDKAQKDINDLFGDIFSKKEVELDQEIHIVIGKSITFSNVKQSELPPEDLEALLRITNLSHKDNNIEINFSMNADESPKTR